MAASRAPGAGAWRVGRSQASHSGPLTPEPAMQSPPGLQNADIAESPARAEEVRTAKGETGSCFFPPKCNPRSSNVVLQLEDLPRPDTAKMLRDAAVITTEHPATSPVAWEEDGIATSPGGP